MRGYISLRLIEAHESFKSPATAPQLRRGDIRIEEIEAMKTKMESLTLPAPDKFTDRWLARVQLKPGTNVREVEAFEKRLGPRRAHPRQRRQDTLRPEDQAWHEALASDARPYPQLTLTAARAAIEALVGKMASGVDVHQEHKD